MLEHRESAVRPYSLVHRAALLGWPADRVEVINEDQGRSGPSAEGWLGFQYLLAEIGLDHVGLILGLEMSPASITIPDENIDDGWKSKL